MYRPSIILCCALLCGALSIATAQGVAAATQAQAATAQPGQAILDDDPSAILGLGLQDLVARFGVPASVAAIRGDEAWQDDVAFVYGAGYSLFVYGNKVWQLRFVKPYAGSLFGLFIGDPASKALSILGQPFEASPAALSYRMPYKSFPVKLRLIVQDDKIVDAYLYRADF
jgi:hypothetical protein